jgi:hypothetical protein
LGIFDGVLLATDLDGTLLNRRHELTKPVRAALRSFTSRGGLFSIATGRSSAGFEEIRPSLPLNAPAILSNGAYIYDYAARKELHVEWLSGGYIDVLEDILNRFPGLGTELHLPGRVRILNFNRWNELHLSVVKCPFELVGDISQAPPPWLKILFVEENKVLRKVMEYASARYSEHFSFFFSAGILLEMQNRGIDKANGVKTVANLYGIEHHHVYTAGDAGNDIGMLHAFESFAPASGTEEARAAASHIVPDCDNDSMVAVIEFLEKRYGG